MHVTLVHVKVKADHVAGFMEATKANHFSSVKEPGNLRFDVLQSADDPTSFVLYEAYISEEAAAAHKQTAHYLTWREAVADRMEIPRQGKLYKGLHPEGSDK